MTSVLRWLGRGLIGVVALAAALVEVGLAWASVSQWRIAAATRIEAPNGGESL